MNKTALALPVLLLVPLAVPLLGAAALVSTTAAGAVQATCTATGDPTGAVVITDADPTGEGGIGFPLPGPGEPRLASLTAPAATIPDQVKAHYLAAAEAYQLPWPLLAGIGMEETAHGRTTATSSAGAQGLMQFMPATWARYGVDGDGDGRAVITNDADSVMSAANYLTASGVTAGSQGVRDALWAYNHADWYVNDVLYYAAAYGGGAITGWDSPPLTVADQRVQRSASPQTYAQHEARAATIVGALDESGASTTDARAGEGPGVTNEDHRLTRVDIDGFCLDSSALVSSVALSGATIPAGAWTAPVRSRINSGFGRRLHPVFGDYRMHNGTDFRAATGTPLAAASRGVVETVTWWGGGGLIVVVAHANDVETWYLHLSQALVAPGDQVEGGQVIALSGNTGVGTAAHFHFETHVSGVAVDPVLFMAQRGVDRRAWSE